MSCIRISLIAVLRLYGKNEATNINRSECKSLTETQWRTEIYLKRDGRSTSVKRKKLSGSDSGWVTIHSCEVVKGIRVDKGFQGKSAIMKASAKKHSPSGFEAMQIAESPKGRKWWRTASFENIFIGQTEKVYIQHFNFYWQVIWVLRQEVNRL